MYRLIYTSQATVPLSAEQLRRLLAKAKQNNRRDGLTGILCHWNGMFAQCLEGPREAVERTFARILDDHRHTRCEVLLRCEVGSRHFGTWAMHLISMDESDPTTAFIRQKYRELHPGDLLFRDPLVVFSLLFDLGEVAKAA